MPEIFLNDFSLGWRPSDDVINGPKNCLLRMQNVKLDETGALTLIPGSSKINTPEQTFAPHTLYSKSINGVVYRFLSRTGDGFSLLFVGTDYNSAFALIAPSLTKAAYGSAYSIVIICSGGSKYYFIPPSTFGQLGFAAPAAPGVTINNPYTKDMTGTIASYTALMGTLVGGAAPFVQIHPDTLTLSGVASLVYGSAQDSTNLSSGSIGTDDDIFTIAVKFLDSSAVGKFTVIFKDFTDSKNYFTHSWTEIDLALPPLQPMNLSCKRYEFEKIGRPKWSNIGEVIVVCDTPSYSADFYFNSLVFSGGTLGSLSGEIEYIQALQKTTGLGFTVVGDLSPITKVVATTTSADIVVTTGGGSDTTYVYRRGGSLDKFYLIKSATGNFTDTVTDEDALLTGIILDETQHCLSTLNESILQIVGPFFNRWLYFTATAIYISKDGQPANYSAGTGIIKPYGSSSEIFLWAEKFGNSAILIGTTNDIYEITGTFSEFPDGTIDATIRPTGCKNPPISEGYAATANELYYVSSDGIRQVSPGGNSPFWVELDLLFKGKTRYTVVPPKVNAGNADKHILAIAHNELYYSFVDLSGLRKMWVYDLLRKYCYEFKSDDGGYGAPVCMYVEEDGKLTAGFFDTGNKFVRVLNTGTLIDGTVNPVVLLRTKALSGETPRQRKDSYTLKLKIDTGSSPVELRIYKDESTTFTSLGFFFTTDLQERIFDLSTVIGLCKSYQIELAGNCSRFKLVDFTIDYDLRPIPLSYFRSQPTNFGIQGRKRFYEIPIVIDTFGTPVTMTPVIDGINLPQISVTTGDKRTFNCRFPLGIVGVDIFYTLFATGGAGFEYYGDVTPRVIEPLPDSVKAYAIPYTNLGTYARKRFIAFAFVIDTYGSNVTFTPRVDGVLYPQKTINTSDRRTFIYYFDNAACEGVDIGGTLDGGLNNFEFFGVSLEECVSEKLPASSTYFVIPATNLGTYARKRFIAYAFVINTRGFQVNFTPVIDGVIKTTHIISTVEKRTVIYYFDVRTEGIDIAGILSSATTPLNYFEFYAVSLEECVSEKLPPSSTFLVLPNTNFGSASRKRIRAIPLVIDTRGSDVVFTPFVDGVAFPTTTFNTTEKRTVLYYFTSDAFGIDVGGVLDGTNNFEFYNVGTGLNSGNQPEIVEILPVGKLFDQLGTVEFLRNANIKSFRVRMVATGTSITYKVYVDDTLRLTDAFATEPNKDKVYEVPWIQKYLNGTTCRIELISTSVFHRISSQLKVNITGQQTQGKWMKMS